LFFNFDDVGGSGDEFPEIRDEFLPVEPCRPVFVMDIEHQVMELVSGVVRNYPNIESVQVITVCFFLPMFQINAGVLLFAFATIRMHSDDVGEITHFSLLSYPICREIHFNSR
jgi:hypothetical protein